MWLKKIKLLSYSATSFSFTGYTEWQILIGFSYSLKPVGFRANSVSFLNFLSQKTYPDEFSRPEGVWNRGYQKKKIVFKMSHKAHQFAIF